MSRRLPPPLPPRQSVNTTISDAPPGGFIVDDAHSPPEELQDERSEVVAMGSSSEVFSVINWRKQVEDQEIQRYLAHFAKHVHHLRSTSPPQSPPPLPRPHLNDYTRVAIWERSRTLREEEEEPTESDSPPSPKDKVSSLEDPSAIDWLAFLSAYIRYLLGPAVQPPPFEPFTIARLRSNSERLYTVARPAWEQFGGMIGDVCLWKNKVKTGSIVFIYTVLVITSTVLPAFLLLPLIPLLKRKFLPPSPTEEMQTALTMQDLAAEASELTEELLELEQPNEERNPGKGIGIRIDMSGVTERVKMGAEGVDYVQTSSDVSPKKSGSRHRLRAVLRKYEDEYGAGTVVVIGDLADLHEKVKNLYLWRSPQTAYSFMIILVTASLSSYFCPLWILVKLIQIFLGALAFVVVPLIAAQERYEPMSWMAGGAPTDAEHAIALLKHRRDIGEHIVLQGEPPRPRSQTPSSAATSAALSPIESLFSINTAAAAKVSHTQRLSEIGNRGLGWLEAARKITAGESEMKLSLAAPGSLEASSGKSTQIALGQHGPRVVLSHRDKGDQAVVEESSTYFAQYGRSPGNLRISSNHLMFRPLIPTKPAISRESGDNMKPESHRSGNVDILMTDVVGIRKRDKTSLLVVISAGLEIECTDGTSVVFTFVAERDQAFTQILMLSKRAFFKV